LVRGLVYKGDPLETSTILVRGCRGELYHKVNINLTLYDRYQVIEDFTNGGRGHPSKHLKFFLLVFSKIKEELSKERIKPKANKKTTSIQEWAPINIFLYNFCCINL